MSKKVIIFGNIGFIGFHLAKKFLTENYQVIGVDNVNNYYSTELKRDRLKILETYKGFKFYENDIAKDEIFAKLIKNHSDCTLVINLAAQPGVRYSIENPKAYIQSNLVGHLNVLEFVRHLPNLEHFMYASSSSVYGNSDKMPLGLDHNIMYPKSLYAATKVGTEALSYSYSSLYNIPTTGFRFFTVYGPWGRPDMAMFSFTDNIFNNKPIKLFNNGDLMRDFTYVDDIVDGLWKSSTHLPKPNQENVPYKIYNLGNNKPEKLENFVKAIESALNRKAIIEYAPMQLGDVYETYADISESQKDFGFHPKTNMQEGVKKFVDWYLDYYNK